MQKHPALPHATNALHSNYSNSITVSDSEDSSFRINNDSSIKDRNDQNGNHLHAKNSKVRLVSLEQKVSVVDYIRTMLKNGMRASHANSLLRSCITSALTNAPTLSLNSASVVFICNI